MATDETLRVAVPPALLFDDGAHFMVYLYRDPRPRRKKAPIYVGKGTFSNKRHEDHWNKSGKRHNPLFGSVLSKIRAAGMKPIVEIVTFFDDEVDAFSLEMALIKRFGRRDLETGTLCNLTDGGEGPSGHRHSVETRLKMRAAQIARHAKRTPEERRAISVKANASRTPEERKSQVIAANAKISSEERRVRATKARAAISQLGPGEFSARVRAGIARRSPEERSAIARKRVAATTPQQRSEIARKRWLKKTSAERHTQGVLLSMAAVAKTTSVEYSARGRAGALARWRK